MNVIERLVWSFTGDVAKRLEEDYLDPILPAVMPVALLGLAAAISGGMIDSASGLLTEPASAIPATLVLLFLASLFAWIGATSLVASVIYYKHRIKNSERIGIEVIR